MFLALSPYHLATRDPAAVAALLLGERVLTLVPAPPGGEDRKSIAAALHRCPAYCRLLESWLWAAPLFRAGVVTSLLGAHDPLDDARSARRRIEADDRWRGLRPFMGAATMDREVLDLDALSADLLKGGPDPGWSLPIVAGLDAVAADRRLLAVRAGESSGRSTGRRTWRESPAQRAERRLARQVFSIGVPVFTQISGDDLLAARAALARPLAALRDAIDAAIDPGTQADPAPLRLAAREFGTAFERLLGTRGGHARDDSQHLQVLDAYVRITGVRLPADAAMLAARVAAGKISSARPAPPAHPAPGSSHTLGALVIEPMRLAPARVA